MKFSPAATEGDIALVALDSLAFGGEAVGRLDGKVIFVPGGLPGERVEIRLSHQKKSYARGEILRVLEPNPHRVIPPCPYYQQCGGCQYQHVDYPTELIWKEKQVLEQLARVARITDPPVQPIIPSPEPYGYRNRISVHVESGKIGFHRGGTRDIVDLTACLLAAPEVNQSLSELRQRRPADGHYSLRSGGVPVSAFFQSNRFLLDQLRQQVRNAADGLQGTLVEGYAGGGFFTATLAPQFQRVLSIESDPRSLRDAAQLALPNVQWIEGQVEEQLERVCRGLEQSPDLVLLDPPRTGLGRLVSESLAQIQARRVIYVSCDPSTMARDALHLKAGYRLASLQPIDLFPRTAQIETIGIWDRLSSL